MNGVSLRTRIAIIAVLSIAALAAVLVIVFEAKARLQANRFAAEQLASDADLFATIRDLDKANLRTLAADLASAPATDDALESNATTPGLFAQLDRVRERLDVPSAAFVLDAKGDTIAGSGDLAPERQAFDLVRGLAAQRDRPETVSALPTGGFAVVVADEVRRGDRVTGYVVLIADLGARLKSFFRSAEALAFVGSERTSLLTGSQDDLPNALVETCCIAVQIAETAGNWRQRSFVTVVPISDAHDKPIGHMVVARDVTDRSRSSLMVNGLAALTVLTGVLMSVGFLLRAVRLSFRPLSAAIRVLEDMLRGDLNVRLRPIQATREIGALVETVEKLREGEEARSRLMVLNTQLTAARNIQQSLLPDPKYDVPGISVFGSMVPAEEVAGDFFDIFETASGDVCLLIGDVAGKGIAAAMFAARASEVIRAISHQGGSVATIMDAANNELCARNPEGLFISVFLAMFTPTTGHVAYVNAGHCPPFVAQSDRDLRILEPDGNIVMGILPDAGYVAGTLDLCPGDRVLVFSDGFDESHNPEGVLMGDDGALEAYRKTEGMTPEATVTDILDAIRDFAGEAPQSDDITLLAFECTMHDLAASLRNVEVNASEHG